MITFETQEDFENAVMAVVAQRMLLDITEERYNNTKTIRVGLVDYVDYCSNMFTCDSFSVDEL